MKKIIDGSLYNTETAKCLGCDEPTGSYRSDVNYYCETLYRTKAGKYFLHGEGGPMSPYGWWQGNTGGYGERIIPYTPADAREWAEKHLTAEEYAEAFGEPEEASDNKEVLTITISVELKRRLIQMREETGKSISQIIEEKFSE